MSEHDEIVRFGFEAGHLSRTPRTGWLLAGVRDPESVAEHSHRAAVLAYLIATMEDADAERACVLAVFHDLPEARTTDLHSMGKRYVVAAEADQVARDQTAGLPAALAGPIKAVIAEVEAKATFEAVCAKDADKLDMLLRAREYQAEGFRLVDEWVTSAARDMRTATGRALAERACVVSPSAWWRDVVAAYQSAPET